MKRQDFKKSNPAGLFEESKMHVEDSPAGGRPLSTAERKVALSTWCRVVREDGSTVAYVPDRATAELIAEALQSK